MAAFIKKWRILLLSVLYFIVFKIAFPNPDIFQDSLGYVAAGLRDAQIDYRPVGYSQFLMLFNGMSNVSFLVVLMQYIIFAGCTWFFNITLFSVFNIKTKWQWIFWAITLYNPLCYFIANFISPDSLFLSFSALWMATLLRFIFYKEHKYIYMGIHLICFFFLFYLRYNAIYYPLFSAFIILFCRMKMQLKVLLAGLSLALSGLLYNSTINKAEQEVGIKILSGFGGWIMANNAIHVMDAVKIDTSIFTDPHQKELHQFVLMFHDSVKRDNTGITDQYMWNNAGPLKRYLEHFIQEGRYTEYLTAWWNVSTLYDDYGKTIIKHYPGAFFRTFLLHNLMHYPAPPPEALDRYNPFDKSLAPESQQFFDYHEPAFTARFPKVEHVVVSAMNIVNAILSPLSILAALICVFTFIRYFIREKGKTADQPLLAAFIFSSFYLITLVLLTFAHPILLRYVGLLVIFFNTLPVLVLITINKKAQQLFTTTEPAV